MMIVTPETRLGPRLVELVLRPLKRAFVGKDEIIDLLGVCLAGGENLFLLGPPGTAKSAIVRELGRRIDGPVFDYLLTRFTEPNELFGPFDIRKLREGELVTNTEGMLPEAAFIFLDELLNANSAILNSLLMVLNERVFRRGRETRPLPSLMVVGASNRLPEDETLGALFDRFLLRVQCDNVADESLADVLAAGWKLDVEGGVTTEHAVSVAEVRDLQGSLARVDLLATRAAYTELIVRLRRAGIAVSDRRAVKLQRLVAASALLMGRESATVTDFWVLKYIWDTEDERELIAGIVQESIERATEAERDTAHPRSQGGLPDAETLARELDLLESNWDQDATNEADRTRSRDRLGVLAGRVPWVAQDAQRGELEAQIARLWRRAGAPA